MPPPAVRQAELGSSPVPPLPSGPTDPSAGRPLASSRRFFCVLLLIVIVGLGVRTAFVLGVARYDKHFYDAAYYQGQAAQVVSGHGFTNGLQAFQHPNTPLPPSAVHPPLTVFVLVPVAWITSDSSLALRFTMVVIGLATVALIALLGRDIAGDSVGLAAAGIAALYPNLWVNDGLIMSETLTAFTVVAALLLTYRLARRPRVLTAAALGFMCGCAILARAEVVLLAPLLAGWLLVRRTPVPLTTRIRDASILLVVCGLVVAPWVGYNLSRFQQATFVSTNDGTTLLASNCDAMYHGPSIGLLVDKPGVCLPLRPPPGDESNVSKVDRSKAVANMRGHLTRLPVVIAARIGRDWSLFRPLDMLTWNEGEGRPAWVTALGLSFYYLLLASAVGGVAVLWRRRVPIWPLLAPAVVVTATALVSYGQTRLRVEAEPSLVILASVALVALFTRWRMAARPPEAAQLG